MDQRREFVITGGASDDAIGVPSLGVPAPLVCLRQTMDGGAAQRKTGLAKVAIFLGTYDGQRYLAQQLESFIAQTHSNWVVCASDDGSTDGTLAIFDQYSRKVGEDRLCVSCGPQRGFVANFLSLTCNCHIQADYYAYSDQDDIWENDKLERAISFLDTVPHGVPAIYCSRTRLVDEGNAEIGFSPLFSRPPCFNNALTQNIGGGNTMVYNNAARELLKEAGEDVDVVTHDWWTYLVVTGSGGHIFYDTYPSVRYRQHPRNLVGTNRGWSSRIRRLRMVWQGRYRDWNNRNIRALNRIRHRLTADNLAMLDRFANARQRRLLPRLLSLLRARVHRQSLPDNLALILAGIFKKI